MNNYASIFIGVLVWLLSATQPAYSQTTDFVTKGATWKYLDDGSDQATTWQASTYDDGSWASGSAKLGYSNGVTTVVSFGSDSSNKYTTTYFRHQFTISNATTYTELQLDLLRDDGAVIYLNGVEVVRDNMPMGIVNYLTRASSAVSGSIKLFVSIEGYLFCT